MGKRNLQSKTEELVYDAINDISDELEIDFDNYPEVYYVDKNFSFNGIGISENERKEFEGVYYFEKNIILLSNQNLANIYEEAGHFLHYGYSGLKYEKMSSLDALYAQAIVEAIGFFCSKLEYSSRKPPYRNYPDYIGDKIKCLKKIESEGIDQNHFFIYQQGYGLGEKLFNHYISGLTSKKKIKQLMSRKMDGKYEPVATFIQLRNFFEKYYVDNLI